MNEETLTEENKEIINPDAEEIEPAPEGLTLSKVTLDVMSCLSECIEYLDVNLAISTAMRDNGSMTIEEYSMILQRNRDANLAVSSIDFEYGVLTDTALSGLPNAEDRLNTIASWCVIDLRDHMSKDLKDDAQKQALDKIQKLIELLKLAGFTKINRMYKIPSKI